MYLLAWQITKQVRSREKQTQGSLHAHQQQPGSAVGKRRVVNRFVSPKYKKVVPGTWRHSGCHQDVVCKLSSIYYSAVLKVLPYRSNGMEISCSLQENWCVTEKTQCHDLDARCDSDPWTLYLVNTFSGCSQNGSNNSSPTRKPARKPAGVVSYWPLSDTAGMRTVQTLLLYAPYLKNPTMPY